VLFLLNSFLLFLESETERERHTHRDFRKSQKNYKILKSQILKSQIPLQVFIESTHAEGGMVGVAWVILATETQPDAHFSGVTFLQSEKGRAQLSQSSLMVHDARVGTEDLNLPGNIFVKI
jgi:hypothetical protein